MPSIKDSRVFDLPQAEIYALMMDMENFPSYVPYIRKAHVAQKHGNVSIADITVGIRTLNFTYRCEVTETPFDKITIREVSGPFKSLRCEMLFEALDRNHTRVTYSFASQFHSRLMNKIADPVFSVQLKSTLRDLERFIRRRNRGRSSH